MRLTRLGGPLLLSCLALGGCEPAIKSSLPDGGAAPDLTATIDGALPDGNAKDGGAPGDGPLPDGGPDLAGATSSGAARYPHGAVTSPITASVAERLKTIASASATREPKVFMKVGASGTVSTNLLFCFAGAAQPQYTLDLDGRDALQGTIDHFRGGTIGSAPDQTTPFDRVTLAAKVGRTASWAISGSPSPLEQEITASNPRFAFVNYGTNDMEQASSYQAALFPFYDNLSTLLDTLEAGGIVPIVSGLNPRSDKASAALLVPTWDVVTRAIAEERQLPYISLYRVSSPLPDLGLLGDGLHGNVLVDSGKVQPCVFTPDGLLFNYNNRNLLSVAVLDAVKRLVLDGAAAVDVGPTAVGGKGTAADPFVIDALPFSHAFTTSDGERLLSTYPGCNATQNEAGPEIYYKLSLPTATPLRALLFDRGAVDVDLHLLTGASCVERNDRIVERTLPAGEHRIVVDSFVSGGVEHAGRYLLVVVPCEAGDASCS